MRCQNINRDRVDAPVPKKIKPEPQKHTYAAIDLEYEDEVSAQRNREHLKKEISKQKPKPDVVRELIKRTLKTRRDMIMGSSRPEDILSEYPHLRKASYVGYIVAISLYPFLTPVLYSMQVFYEFDLIINLQNSYESFTEAWILWKQAIMEYASSSISKSKMLQHALRDLDSNDSGNPVTFCLWR